MSQSLLGNLTILRFFVLVVICSLGGFVAPVCVWAGTADSGGKELQPIPSAMIGAGVALALTGAILEARDSSAVNHYYEDGSPRVETYPVKIEGDAFFVAGAALIAFAVLIHVAHDDDNNANGINLSHNVKAGDEMCLHIPRDARVQHKILEYCISF